ncbi:MAG: gliding motility-associated ABC transporter substrate-binding protein GldG, partial [Prolixibacteraceae bacterium]
LVKKELLQFFGSLIAYMILVVFALISGLFLWFFEGNINILNGGYASMSSFFDLAPWLYLFLIPAITMRLFSEEVRSGTMELLFTRPVSVFQLIFAKLLAAFFVVFLTLLLSLVYFYTVYLLGNPVGIVDAAATMGSYLGLLFLALIFLSVGIFCSSISENQMVAFVLAVLISFFLFSGFELLADLTTSVSLSSFLLSIGISSHYESMSSGLVDSRDLFYFLTITAIFIFITGISLRWNRTISSFRLKSIFPYLLVILPLIYFSQIRFFRIDFTSEKRFTLSESSISLLKKIDQPLMAEIYLEGDMPPGFRRLRTAIEEKLNDLQKVGKKSVYIRKVDPYKEVSAKDRNAYFDELFQRGIVPADLRIKTEQGITTKLVFPSVVLHYKDKSVVLNLLKNDPAIPAEENLNRSIEMLEYEMMNAIRNLLREKPIHVAFLEGHQEADSLQVLDFSTALSADFVTSRVSCNKLLLNPDSISVLIVANPQSKFDERDKLILDQFIMKGGKVIWLIDPVKVSLDSLSEGMTTLALPVDLNFNDQLYHYGARVNNDLIQDAECLQIKVNTAPSGASPNYSSAPWYFSPLLHPLQSHPIGKYVNPLSSEFVSSMDTVGENPAIKKSVLLCSSPFSRKNEAPLLVNLRMIDVAPSRNFFNKSNLITGLLLEGKFTSVFKNRMIEMPGIPSSFKPLLKSAPTKVAIFSDGGLLSNKVNRASKEVKTAPLGYDRVSKITWGNKDFFFNLVQYFTDDASLIELRGKNWQLRVLDKVKVGAQGSLFKWLNMILPLFLILIGGLLFTWKRKYRNEYGNRKT